MALPDLYIFNPTAEMALANGTASYQAPEILQQFEKDLAPLLCFMVHKKDAILVHQQPGKNYITSLKTMGFMPPEFYTKNDITDKNLKFNKLKCWTFTKAIDAELKSFVDIFLKYPDKIADIDIFLRLKSAEVLYSVCSQLPDIFADYNELEAHQCFTVNHINSLLNKWGAIVLKAPLSSSGRGLQILRKPKLNESNTAWINSVLTKQKFVMAEQLHDKMADFSLHFHKSNKTKYLGLVRFKTNSNGQFQGCLLNKFFNEEWELIIKQKITEDVIALLERILDKHYPSYQGYLGIDMMLIKQSGQLNIHPCVEVNPRFTMGLITLKLNEFFGSIKGEWRIYQDKHNKFKAYLKGGSIPLTPIQSDTQFAAILHPD